MLKVITEEILAYCDWMVGSLPGKSGMFARQIYVSLRYRRWIKKLRLAQWFEWNGYRGLELGSGLRIAKDCRLLAQGGKIRLGDRTGINFGTLLDATPHGEIWFGNEVIVGPGCVFRACNHDFTDPGVPILAQGHRSGKIEIGDGTWIGANCTVVAGVKIGKHAIIGAGSVVTRSIPDYAIAAGIPAQVIKSRLNDSKIPVEADQPGVAVIPSKGEQTKTVWI